jgi:hypothetical protein
MAKDPGDRPDSAEEVSKTLTDLGSTPLPAHRGRKTRPAPVSSLPPSEGLASTSHLGETRSPVYKDPGPAVPATPVIVTVVLVVAAVLGMAMLGFVLGAVALAVI